MASAATNTHPTETASTGTDEHLHDVIAGFGVAMLTTQRSDGQLHARPMAVAKLTRDGDMYFATSLTSPKIDEIEAQPDVAVTFQDGGRFAVIYGVAAVSKDRALIEELWSPEWRVWFPQGKDDPNLCLLRIDGREAEYWNNSGVQGLKYLFKGLKAVLQGTTPTDDSAEHGKVQLP